MVLKVDMCDNIMHINKSSKELYTPGSIYNMPLGLTRSQPNLAYMSTGALGKVFEAVGICRAYCLSFNR